MALTGEDRTAITELISLHGHLLPVAGYRHITELDRICPKTTRGPEQAGIIGRDFHSSAARNVRHVWARASSCPGRACRSEARQLLAELPQPPRCRVVAGGLGGLTPLAFDVVTARRSGYLRGRGQVHDGAGAALR
jgi:hypothetical protein